MKLLVCDDDISTIDVIQSRLDCNELGISTILRAYNGVMAKEIIDSEKPELILCDIGMPLCNGLEVLEYCYEKNRDAEFAFLTCYEKFEYAQKAIKYGVTAYLTKPFEIEEVKSCLKDMIKNAKEKSKPAEEVKKASDALMSAVFRQACDGMLGTNKDMVEAGLKLNGIDFDADSRWRIVYTKADITDAIKNNWNKDLILFTLARLHDEALTGYVGSAHTVVNSDDRFVQSLCFVKDAPDDDVLKERCKKFVEFAKVHMSLSPVTLISEEFAFYNTSLVVVDLYDRMRKINHHSGEIFFMTEQISENSLNNVSISDTQVLWYIKNKDLDGYKEYIKTVLDETYLSRANLDKLRKELMNIFIVYFRDNGMSINTIFKDSDINELDGKASENRQGLSDYAEALFNLQQAQAEEAYDSEDIVARAKRYIDENFRDDIDRNDVAAVTFVTPNYLSKVFKNSLNMNLREYINQLRIEEAKRLLLSTNMSVSEVASYVGYCNISYFSTVFHKIVGVGPFDWRSKKED